MTEKIKSLFRDKNKLSKILFVAVLVCTVVFMSDLTALATQNSGNGYGYGAGDYAYGYGYWTESGPTLAMKYNGCTASCSISETTAVTITATFSSAPSGTPDVKIVEGSTTTQAFTAMTGTGTTWTYAYTTGSVSASTTATVSVRTLAGTGYTPTATNGTFTVTDSAAAVGGGGTGSGATATPVTVVAPTETTTTTTTLTPTEIALVVPVKPAVINLDAEKEGLAKFIEITNALPTTEANWQVVNFIAYGTDASSKMSVRDRKGVIGDYFEVYGRVPSSDSDWEDISLILTSHKPHQRKLAAEKQALVDFIKVYKRLPDFKNINDEWAVYYIAYNIRNVVRNLNSERAAIGTFKSVYKYLPSTSHQWSIMRAIGYTGAKR